MSKKKDYKWWVVSRRRCHCSLTAYTWFPYAMTPTPLLLLLMGVIRVHCCVVGSYASAVIKHSVPLNPPHIYTCSQEEKRVSRAVRASEGEHVEEKMNGVAGFWGSVLGGFYCSGQCLQGASGLLPLIEPYIGSSRI